MRFLIFILGISLIFSCRILSWEEQLEMDLPVLSDNLFDVEPEGWVVAYLNRDGDYTEEILDGDLEQSVIIDVEKGAVSPILLQPFFSLNGDRIVSAVPAGFLYPYDGDSLDECRFKWDRGPLCRTLLDSAHVINSESVNLPRLMELTEEKAEGESLWVLDWQIILEELASGELSYYDVRKKRSRSVSLILKEGIWMNCDPRSPDLVSEGIDVPLETSLYRGISLFLHSSGSVAEFFVHSDGTYEYIIY